MADRRKAHILSQDEHFWRGFIIDLDVRDALPLFRRAHVTRFAKDPETVHEGWVGFRTIVTANEKDFVRYILAHSNKDSGRICQDCWGLLVLPGNAVTRARLIPKVKNGIKIGGLIIPWRAVAYANLCVTLHSDGSVGVRRFARCIRCDRDFPIKEQWYLDLPVIRKRKSVPGKK
jgi:hypothetical protein